MPQALLGGERREAIHRLCFGKQARILQAARNPKEFVAMLVRNSDGDGHGDDAAENGRPVGDEEALVRLRSGWRHRKSRSGLRRDPVPRQPARAAR